MLTNPLHQAVGQRGRYSTPEWWSTRCAQIPKGHSASCVVCPDLSRASAPPYGIPRSCAHLC